MHRVDARGNQHTHRDAGNGAAREVMEEILQVLDEIIERVAPRFDRILLDTGAGISDVVLHAISLADDVLVIATPEPTSMTDAYATIKLLAIQQGRRAIRVVVNQVSATGEGAWLAFTVRMTSSLRTADPTPLLTCTR